ncbi:hypothetical protein LJC26_08880 [Desulfovibrio sp. OttesenSCG-928-O18]|nr:hypothetical protein [Desulfovibrio sp. OttesenSCG-928-O18]
MQPLSFPPDMRESVITRRQVFMAGARTLVMFIAVLFLVMFGIYFGTAVYKYSTGPVLEHFPQLMADFLHSLWIVPPLLALFFLVVYRQTGRQKLVGIPMLFGYDEEQVYFRSMYGSSASRWELFNSWQETRDFLLLHDGTRKIMWPKSLWSVEELAGQRALMQAKITPKRMTPP